MRWQVRERDGDPDRRLDVEIEEIAAVSKDVRPGIKAQLDCVEHGGLGRVSRTNETVHAEGWRLFQHLDSAEVLHFHIDDAHLFPRLCGAIAAPIALT